MSVVALVLGPAMKSAVGVDSLTTSGSITGIVVFVVIGILLVGATIK